MRDTWQMRHRLRVTKMARLGTPYCGALREQNSCQCEACFTVAAAAAAVVMLKNAISIIAARTGSL